MKDLDRQHIFNQWLKQHRRLLFKIVHAYAFTLEDKDDLFQEIAMQIWRSVPSFRGESAESTWLYRIALNTALKWKAKEKKRIDNYSPMNDMDIVLQVQDEIVDEKLGWLYSEISKLDKVDRSITLLMLDGFSYEEMADMLGISKSNIGVKIHRIKKHLITKSEQANM